VIEVVVKRGYKRATVREIASIASVSTRDFYQHYPTKEKCFVRTHGVLAQRLLSCAGESGVGAEQDTARIEAVVGAITDEWGRSPELVRFFLFSPHEVGPAALRQLRLAERSLAARLVTSFAFGSGDKRLASMVSTGIVTGLFSVARALTLDDRGCKLLEIRDDLIQWASAYLSCLPNVESFEASRARINWDEVQRRLNSSSRQWTRDRAASPMGDAALLCSAVTKIAASGDQSELTIRNICIAAGLSRARFYAHFDGLEECLAEAQRMQMYVSLARASRVAEMVPNRPGRMYCGLTSFCMQIAHDPGLANLCFGEFIASGVWNAKRERRLIEGLTGLLDVSACKSWAEEHPIPLEASLGAALGLIRSEMETGSFGVHRQMTPFIEYLTLASVAERSGHQVDWAHAS
jgi:AcrR family transcriptional regulator